MRYRIPGFNLGSQEHDTDFDALFLVRVDKALPLASPKAFLQLRFAILESRSLELRSFSARLYSTEKAVWKLNWFLRDFGYDPESLSREQVDEKALTHLCGIARTSCTWMRGRRVQSLEGFAPAAEWQALSHLSTNAVADAKGSHGL